MRSYTDFIKKNYPDLYKKEMKRKKMKLSPFEEQSTKNQQEKRKHGRK